MNGKQALELFKQNLYVSWSNRFSASDELATELINCIVSALDRTISELDEK